MIEQKRTLEAQRLLREPDKIQRIAIFRALYLGDLLLSVPAVRALRSCFPQAEITLIGLPWAVSFVQRYRHYIDRFIEFPGYPGIREVPVDEDRLHSFCFEQRNYNYDLVIQMHGSGNASNPFVAALGGQVSAGYYEREYVNILSLATPYPQHEHEIIRNLGLAKLVGCKISEIDTKLEFPLFESDHAEATTLLRTLPRAQRPWVGLHVGSRSPARRWPAEYFASVANELVKRYNAQIILTGGSGEEATIQTVVEQLQVPALNLTGKTSLGGLAALINKLDLFISNDTGPAHISHAVNRPSITLFGPADVQRWEPLDKTMHPIARRPVACSPCGYWECPIDHRCLRWLRPASVLQLAYPFLTDFKRVINTSNVSYEEQVQA